LQEQRCHLRYSPSVRLLLLSHLGNIIWRIFYITVYVEEPIVCIDLNEIAVPTPTKFLVLPPGSNGQPTIILYL
jgi:hypothetical protein